MLAPGTQGNLASEPEKSDLREIQSGQSSLINKVQPHFMLVPSLACQASCFYCFGPHQGTAMSPGAMESALDFMARIVNETHQRKAKVTFHGGEPLLAGHGLWRQALQGLRERFGPQRYEVALQSNLWLMDEEFCELFREHGVEVGTSLDGPEAITDAQRGPGYFQRTLAGIRLAEARGLQVGCIATFTPASARRWREVFDFFLSQRLCFSVHAAVPSLDHADTQEAISPGQFGDLLCAMLDYYVQHRHDLKVSSLDQMCQAFGCGTGKVCTFRNCLGMFLAIDPTGDIYPCQRFCGRPGYRLGTLDEQSSLEELLHSPVAKGMHRREQCVREACDGCPHLDYCLGGCPYNAWAAQDQDKVRDPYCPAYRAAFDHIQARLLKEVASERNIGAMAERPWDGREHPLFRAGPLIDLVRQGPHPSQVARSARRIVAAVELARGPNLDAVASRLVRQGVCRCRQSALVSLARLQRQLQPRPGLLNNLYLHVTFRCQLHCTHCYARADALGRSQGEMPVEAVGQLVRQAREAGFRQVVITGGEPLVHSCREDLLAALQAARSWAAPMNLVLRTNLALRLEEDDLSRLALAFDQVVVSLDGSEQTHDARRGRGSYAATLKNLEGYLKLAPHIPDAGELSLATVMRSADIQGKAGEAVREAAARLRIKRVRFRPLLPLGRAADWNEPPVSEALGTHLDPVELLESGFQPSASCGLGQNLYVEPSGDSYPCYACCQPEANLGNVIDPGLGAVLHSVGFRQLAAQTVDTNLHCRTCELRYLCGDTCRAWSGKPAQGHPGLYSPGCEGRRQRANLLLVAALHYLPPGQLSEVTPCSDG